MFTVNHFTLGYVFLVAITVPLAVLLIVRHWCVSESRADFVFGWFVLAGAAWSSTEFLIDNVVPYGVRATDVPGAAERTLNLFRIAYSLGIVLMVTVVHFTVEYTRSKYFARIRVWTLYVAAALAIVYICFSGSFLRARTEPIATFSSWRVAVPWMVETGTETLVYAVIWAISMGFVQYVCWSTWVSEAKHSSASAQSLAVRTGLLAFAASGLVDLWCGVQGYAGVSISTGVAWLGIAVVGIGRVLEWRFIERERMHIRRRFESYVDPTLVKYLIDHPDQARFDGEVRSMTVAFSDLSGYTSLTEKLKARAVPILNSYFSTLTPIIRDQNGFRSKFLGDGMMFFFGAPLWTEQHASNAVTCALKMQEALDEFNTIQAEHGLPEFVTRIGLNSGEMIVGDTGSHEASDYTVFGAEVNIAARLESANRHTGTRVLIGENTKALLPDDRFLLRPVGKLKLIGVANPIACYEPLAFAEEATIRQRNIVQMTTEMVEAFQAGRLAECKEVTDRFLQAFGPSKLAELYKRVCEERAGESGANQWDGAILLPSK